MNAQTRIGTQHRQGHRLIQWGILLFLLGLLTGFAVPIAANPRMGLSSHLEGVMNGVFLIVIGLVWERLRLKPGVLTFMFWLALYGTFVNWGTTLLAAFWNAGRSMPLAAPAPTATDGQEMLVNFGLFSLSFAMVIVCALALWGLRWSATTHYAATTPPNPDPASLQSP